MGVGENLSSFLSCAIYFFVLFSFYVKLMGRRKCL